MNKLIACLPGDGIGTEIMAIAQRVLERLGSRYGHSFQCVEGRIGGAAIDHCGDPLPAATLALCRKADAVLLGAVGGPKWDDPKASVRPEQGLLRIRQALGLFANLRPVQTCPALFAASAVKAERLRGVDLLLVRELTGGIYFGAKSGDATSASDICNYTATEIERVVRLAASLAQQRRGRLTLIDKANVLATSRLWRQVTRRVVEDEFTDLDYEEMLVDATAMHLINQPAHFDVLVTENLFGDILSDEAAVLAASPGMLASACLGADDGGLFEPVHGSAPDLAGADRANPFGMILSVAMALEQALSLAHEARALRAAVQHCIDHGETTEDLGGTLGTRACGDAVIEQIGNDKPD